MPDPAILPEKSVTARRATNVTLAEDLLREARALQINVSQAAEAGLAQAVALRRAQSWLEENAAALSSSNAYVDQQGLPLEKHKMF